MKSIVKISFCMHLAVLVAFVTVAVEAQTRRSRTEPRNPATPASELNTSSAAQPSPSPPKRNERPNDPGRTRRDGATSPDPAGSVVAAYEYEFSQPDFAVTYIKIVHDKDGAGTISFRKKGSEELITDPIRVSPKSIARVNDALITLNFLESTENYQHERDFSHLGVVKFTYRGGGRSRDVTLNWTENKDAKVFMDEYRKIANQYIWIFDISLSRDNQPLDAPRLLDSLDSLIRRNEISDPHQMEQFLRQLADDERIPLIARNHAAKLVKQFEKEKAKEEKKRSEGTN
jgi:hypothetical protein